MGLFSKSLDLPTKETALPGRSEEMPVPAEHFVNGHPMKGPFPGGTALAMFGMGCFWGAERRFWEVPGVYVTAVGYAGGLTPNPSYEEVCSGRTGHNEVVLAVYNTAEVEYEQLLALFWESHDPTQGMRQGNDIGTQYRSGIYTFTDEQQAQALASQASFQAKLKASGYSDITTEIVTAPEFYYAEHFHQQYLAKVPNGYCGLGGTGVCYNG
ncbi:MAG: peptide-methionine (S)-S-oxide reductase MsrA [Gammaproteobacteria bacterium]